MVILPIASILVEYTILGTNSSFELIGKWFLFWAVGMRLFTAGLSQAVRPGFTAQSIFKLTDKENFAVVRELGFANISMGLVCIVSLFFASWRIPAAFAGALFFGIAGTQHMIKGPISANERVPTITNWIAFLVMVVYLVSNAIL